MEIRYFDREETPLTCPECGWFGLGCEVIEVDDEDLWRGGSFMHCPRCRSLLGTCAWPTLAEKRAHFDRLSPEEQRSVAHVEERLRLFEVHKLRSADQLPELDPPPTTLEWDFAEKEGHWWTLIRQGDRILWQEIAFYEGYWRFLEVVPLLRERYGPTLRDLAPTPESKLYLYGDYHPSLELVRKARASLREGR